MKAGESLRAIKIFHTIVWAFFVGCIAAIPVFGFTEQYRLAAVFIGIIFLEVLILAVNKMSCPLTMTLMAIGTLSLLTVFWGVSKLQPTPKKETQ